MNTERVSPAPNWVRRNRVLLTAGAVLIAAACGGENNSSDYQPYHVNVSSTIPADMLQEPVFPKVDLSAVRFEDRVLLIAQVLVTPGSKVVSGAVIDTKLEFISQNSYTTKIRLLTEDGEVRIDATKKVGGPRIPDIRFPTANFGLEVLAKPGVGLILGVDKDGKMTDWVAWKPAPNILPSAR